MSEMNVPRSSSSTCAGDDDPTRRSEPRGPEVLAQPVAGGRRLEDVRKAAARLSDQAEVPVAERSARQRSAERMPPPPRDVRLRVLKRTGGSWRVAPSGFVPAMATSFNKDRPVSGDGVYFERVRPVRVECPVRTPPRLDGNLAQPVLLNALEARPTRPQGIGSGLVGERHPIAPAPLDAIQADVVRAGVANVRERHLVAVDVLFLADVPRGHPSQVVVQPVIRLHAVQDPRAVTLRHDPEVPARIRDVPDAREAVLDAKTVSGRRPPVAARRPGARRCRCDRRTWAALDPCGGPARRSPPTSRRPRSRNLRASSR